MSYNAELLELKTLCVVALGDDVALYLRWPDGVTLDVYRIGQRDDSELRYSECTDDELHAAAVRALGKYTGIASSFNNEDGKRFMVTVKRNIEPECGEWT